MDIIKWDSLLPNDLFADFPSMDMTGWDLATDLYEEQGNIIVEMQIPGIDSDHYEVSVKDGILHVSGSREQKRETQDRDYFRKEIHRGHFERFIPLPKVELRTDQLSVSHENGTLKIFLPKV